MWGFDLDLKNTGSGLPLNKAQLVFLECKKRFQDVVFLPQIISHANFSHQLCSKVL